ncbi:RNA polymerase sigma-70 factor [Larkinella punicea]|uniref:RNA polymerase sigma-70 factor n=1 Tax=Larkinella punicea TaxID=2315727 RepID=A0A368JRN1_9BACT|nr:RNA polymerase sigma-70 factor [Larkinella punicea]RCR70320.1 RNA polymerase sigma-70 factor [Larkinella punicea]
MNESPLQPDFSDERRPDARISLVVPMDPNRAADPEWMIRRMLQSDPVKGFELLYQRYYGPLCSHVTRLVYSREIGEDLVGDLFFHLWQTNQYTQITGSFRAYLFSAARNRAINYLRWEFNRTEPTEDNELTDPADSTESDTDLAFEELTTRIHRALDALPPQCRNVFVLSRFEGRKNSEIGADLHISVKTVEGHLTKALSRLRQALHDYWLVLLLLLTW